MDRTIDVKVPTFIITGYLIIHSIVLWVQGFAFFAIGVFLYTVLKNFFIDETGLKEAGNICYFLGFTGVGLMLVSFFTNYVLFNQSVRTYALLALTYGLMMIFQVLLCLAGFYYIYKVKTSLRLAISSVMANYNANNYINVILNTMQSMLTCCGSTGYSSWFLTGWADNKPRVPESCCKNIAYCHNLEPLMVEDIHKRGCNSSIEFLASSAHAANLGILILAITAESFGIIACAVMSIRFQKLQELNSAAPIVERSMP